MMLVPYCSEYKVLTEFNNTTFNITQCNLHKSAKCPIDVFLGTEKGGLFKRHIVSHIKMEGTPPPLPVSSTQLNISKSGRFSQRFILCSKMQHFFFFTCLGELMFCFKDFLFCYVRYYLSLVTRKPVFGVFGQLRFNLVCSATDVS